MVFYTEEPNHPWTPEQTGQIGSLQVVKQLRGRNVLILSTKDGTLWKTIKFSYLCIRICVPLGGPMVEVESRLIEVETGLEFELEPEMEIEV